MSTKILLGDRNHLVRLSYVHVDQPRIDPSGNENYSLQVLLPKIATDQHDRMQKAVDLELKKMFTDKGQKIPPKAHNPIKDGDGEKLNGDPYPPECKGHWVINAKTSAANRKPLVVNAKNEVVHDPGFLRSGDYGCVQIALYGYTAGSGGVGVGLENIQKVRDGEPLGGGADNPASVFSTHEEEFLA
jgi:hypothetical protein